MTKLTFRQQAEAIEQFGDDLIKLLKGLDDTCRHMDADTLNQVNAILERDDLDRGALAFKALGDLLCREDDEAEEAADRRRMVSVGGHRDGGSAA